MGKMANLKINESGEPEVGERGDVGEARRIILEFTQPDNKAYHDELVRFIEVSKLTSSGTARANKSMGIIRKERMPDRLKSFFSRFKPVGESRSKFLDEDGNPRFVDGVDSLCMTLPRGGYIHGGLVQRCVLRAGESMKPFAGEVCVILVITFENGTIQVRFEDMPRGLQSGKIDPKDQTASTY